MRLNAIVRSAISSRPRTGMGSVALRRATSQAEARSSRSGRAILRLANPAIASDTRRLVDDREQRHEPALLLEAPRLGSAPPELGAGMPVEPLEPPSRAGSRPARRPGFSPATARRGSGSCGAARRRSRAPGAPPPSTRARPARRDRSRWLGPARRRAGCRRGRGAPHGAPPRGEARRPLPGCRSPGGPRAETRSMIVRFSAVSRRVVRRLQPARDSTTPVSRAKARKSLWLKRALASRRVLRRRGHASAVPGTFR